MISKKRGEGASWGAFIMLLEVDISLQIVRRGVFHKMLVCSVWRLLHQVAAHDLVLC